MAQTPEGKVKKQITDWLDRYRETHHLEYFRRDAIGFNYKEGLPDLWLVCNGKHLEIETKAPGGSPSGPQLKWEARFKRCGSLYWRGHSLADFIAYFTENVEH